MKSCCFFFGVFFIVKVSRALAYEAGRRQVGNPGACNSALLILCPLCAGRKERRPCAQERSSKLAGTQGGEEGLTGSPGLGNSRGPWNSAGWPPSSLHSLSRVCGGLGPLWRSPLCRLCVLGRLRGAAWGQAVIDSTWGTSLPPSRLRVRCAWWYRGSCLLPLFRGKRL